ncbi:MAG: T9SS C-terminal target domain-containing protein, partial [Bacteroidetes bacterium]
KREETLDNSNREQAELINNIGLFPNPAIESTIINFDIQEDSRISVELLDFKGQVLKKLAENKYYPTGRYEMLVDIKSLSQGIYLISLTDENGFKKVHKLIKQ